MSSSREVILQHDKLLVARQAELTGGRAAAVNLFDEKLTYALYEAGWLQEPLGTRTGIYRFTQLGTESSGILRQW